MLLLFRSKIFNFLILDCTLNKLSKLHDSLNFDSFDLEEPFSKEKDSSEYSNFYSSSYYGFIKLKGKLTNVKLSLTRLELIKKHNYYDIIYAALDEVQFLI